MNPSVLEYERCVPLLSRCLCTSLRRSALILETLRGLKGSGVAEPWRKSFSSGRSCSGCLLILYVSAGLWGVVGVERFEMNLSGYGDACFLRTFALKHLLVGVCGRVFSRVDGRLIGCRGKGNSFGRADFLGVVGSAAAGLLSVSSSEVGGVGSAVLPTLCLNGAGVRACRGSLSDKSQSDDSGDGRKPERLRRGRLFPFTSVDEGPRKGNIERLFVGRFFKLGKGKD